MHESVVIVGAGQAGLAMSHCLTQASVSHVLLERSTVAHSWRNERWDSLRLLTPNWMTKLPGHEYGTNDPSGQGDDPQGFETATEIATRLVNYATSFGAPVREGVSVNGVHHDGEHFVVNTSDITYTADAVVIATGACSKPNIPHFADRVPARVHQVSPIHYKRPDDLPDGDVLVVGASASGVQLADELARNGRRVTVATGKHTRMPRTYRGRDILEWMSELGWLDQTIEEFGVDELRVRRTMPSMQLVGCEELRSIDLNTLRSLGVRLAGRLINVENGVAQFDDSLPDSCAAADAAMFDKIHDIEKSIESLGADADFDAPETIEPTDASDPVAALDLHDVGTIVWATGFVPDWPWLDEQWLDARGAVVHEGGIVDERGLYVLGLPILRQRSSNFISGVGVDAAQLAEQLVASLVS